MLLKNILDEDFVNYKKPCMFLATCYCDWKCCIADDSCHCQNSDLAMSPSIRISKADIVKRYLSNSISESIVIAGLEPMLQIDDILELISLFRAETEDDIVIYTGYYEDEIIDEIKALSKYSNIIVKFGRYISGQEGHFDETLGVSLVNKEQYARKIS